MLKKSIDSSVNQILDRVKKEKIETIWDRSIQQEPRCGFGELGICCRNCYMGPCRIDPFGQGPQRGVCGATAEIIVARNFGRMKNFSRNWDDYSTSGKSNPWNSNGA